MSSIYSFRSGEIPLLVSIPHNGSQIPEAIATGMTENGKSSRDTDWFLDRLYDFPELSEASCLVANYSRYVIDLNRPENNESLYPGQATTGLVPQVCFDGSSIYAGELPGQDEVARRIEDFWRPYHQCLVDEMTRLRGKFGFAVLVEAHSIASRIPRLFEGRLPDFNLGTNHGKTCAKSLQDSIELVLESQKYYSHVTNGRFVGGHITRQFGQPAENWHAVQFELSQDTYMDETKLVWDETKSARVQPLFRSIFSAIKDWIQNQ